MFAGADARAGDARGRAPRPRGRSPHRPDLQLLGHAPLRPRAAGRAVRRRRSSPARSGCASRRPRSTSWAPSGSGSRPSACVFVDDLPSTSSRRPSSGMATVHHRRRRGDDRRARAAAGRRAAMRRRAPARVALSVVARLAAGRLRFGAACPPAQLRSQRHAGSATEPRTGSATIPAARGAESAASASSSAASPCSRPELRSSARRLGDHGTLRDRGRRRMQAELAALRSSLKGLRAGNDPVVAIKTLQQQLTPRRASAPTTRLAAAAGDPLVRQPAEPRLSRACRDRRAA